MVRIYTNTVKKWAIGLGIPSAAIVFLLFLYLQTLGYIEITGYSGDIICGGTEDDPCYAYINFTAKQDIFIYPVGYDPWGRETPFEFSKELKDWKLQRSWGKYWRDIPLDKTCTGTWCGAPSKTEVKYSIVFRKGRSYQIRIVAYKKDAFEDVKWSFGELDPVWKGIGKYHKISIAGRKYTPQCLVDCHLPFNITLYKDLTFEKSDFKKIVKRQIGKFDIIDWGFDYLKNKTYNESEWIPDIKCYPYNETTPNGTITTYPNCTDEGSYQIFEKWKYVWKPVPSTINIKANKFYIIDLWIKKKPSLGFSGIDIVPKLKDYELTKLSWWNSSWTRRINVIVTEPNVIARTFEPIETYLEFSSGLVTNCSKEIRVVDDAGNEITSGIYNETYSGGYCLGATVVWITNFTQNQEKTFSIYYGNPSAIYPDYSTDIEYTPVDVEYGGSKEAWIINTSYLWANMTELGFQSGCCGSSAPIRYPFRYSIEGNKNWDIKFKTGESWGLYSTPNYFVNLKVSGNYLSFHNATNCEWESNSPTLLKRKCYGAYVGNDTYKIYQNQTWWVYSKGKVLFHRNDMEITSPIPDVTRLVSSMFYGQGAWGTDWLLINFTNTSFAQAGPLLGDGDSANQRLYVESPRTIDHWHLKVSHWDETMGDETNVMFTSMALNDSGLIQQENTSLHCQDGESAYVLPGHYSICNLVEIGYNTDPTPSDLPSPTTLQTGTWWRDYGSTLMDAVNNDTQASDDYIKSYTNSIIQSIGSEETPEGINWIKTYDETGAETSFFSAGDTVTIKTSMIVNNNLKTDLDASNLTLTNPAPTIMINNETTFKFWDDFINANWWNVKTASSSWSIDSERYKFLNATEYHAITIENETYNYTNLTIEAKINISSSTEDSARLIFRYENDTDYSALFMTKYYSAFGIEDWVDGTRYFSEVSKLINLNQIYTMKVVVEGNKASAFLDGVNLTTRTLNANRIVAGKVGLGADAGTILFDNYTVTSSDSTAQVMTPTNIVVTTDYTIPLESASEGTWTINYYMIDFAPAIVDSDSATFNVSYSTPYIRTLTTYNSTYDEVSIFHLDEKVIIRSNITDPQGAIDLDKVLINLTNPADSLKVTNTEMTNVTTITNGYIYEYNYTIPIEYNSYGEWDIDIFANDTTDNKTTKSSTFDVEVEWVTVYFPETNYTKWFNTNVDNNITYIKSIEISDIDNDNTNEIIDFGRSHNGTGTNQAMLQIWNVTKTDTNFTLNKEAETYFYKIDHTFGYSIFVYDIDEDGTKEIVTGGVAYNGSHNLAYLGAWNYTDGTLKEEDYTTWLTVDDTAIYGIYVWNNNGAIKIISIGTSGGTEKIQTRVWNYTGGVFNLENSTNWGLGYAAEGYVIKVGDPDEDGTEEIITAGYVSDGTRLNAFVRIYNYTGTTLNIENTTYFYKNDITEIFGLDMGDVDDDGNIEIVTSGNWFDGTRDNLHIRVWNYTGNTLTVQHEYSDYIAGHASILTVIVKDVDKDGIPEIIGTGFQNDGLYDRGERIVLNYSNTDGFVVEMEKLWEDDNSVRDGDFSDAAKLEDIDGDGMLDLISGGRYKMTPPMGTFIRIGSFRLPNFPPQWKNNATSVSSPAGYSTTQNYGFEVEWSDDNDINGYNFSYFEHNFTGTMNNYTALRNGNISYYNFTGISVGGYVFKFYANDSEDAWNSTDQWNYTITIAGTSIKLYLNDTENNITIAYGNALNITAQINVTGLPVELYKVFEWNSTYRKPLEVQQTGSTTLYNIPINVSVDTNSLITAGKLDNEGKCLRFINAANDAELDWEYESYSDINYGINTSNTVIWLEIDELPVANTTVYMHYSNGICSWGNDTIGTWDNGYQLVFHLSEGTGTITNGSTTNAWGGELKNGAAWNTTGYFGNNILFDGTDDYIDAGDVDINHNLTIEIWGNLEEWNEYGGFLVEKGADGNENYEFAASSGGITYCMVIDGTRRCGTNSSHVLEFNEWYYLVLAYTDNDLRMYINGTSIFLETSYSGDLGTDDAILAIGTDGSRLDELAKRTWTGRLDEVRISNVFRNEDYIKRQWQNDLVEWGAEETGLIANATTTVTDIRVWEPDYFQIKASYPGNATYNSSQKIYYANITKAPTTIYLAINGTEDDVAYGYPNVTNTTAWKTVTGGTLTLLRNGSIVSNPEIIKLGVGDYNYTTTLTHENYTASSVTRILTINKNTLTQDYMNLTINGTETNKIYTYPAISNTTGWYSIDIFDDQTITFTLYRNTTIIGTTNPINNILSLGAKFYNYTYHTEGNTNYSSATKQYNLTINKGGTLIDLYFNTTKNADKSISVDEGINITGVMNVSGYTVYLDLNKTGFGVNFESGTTVVTNITSGTVLGKDKFNVTGHFNGNENLKASYKTQYLTVKNVSISVSFPENTTEYRINISSCMGPGCYQNGTYTPENQSTAQWIFQINNTGDEITNVTAYFNDTLNACMAFYLVNTSSYLFNYDSGFQYNITGTTPVKIYYNLAAFPVGYQNYWSWVDYRNCTAGTRLDLDLYFEAIL